MSSSSDARLDFGDREYDETLKSFFCHVSYLSRLFLKLLLPTTTFPLTPASISLLRPPFNPRTYTLMFILHITPYLAFAGADESPAFGVVRLAANEDVVGSVADGAAFAVGWRVWVLCELVRSWSGMRGMGRGSVKRSFGLPWMSL